MLFILFFSATSFIGTEPKQAKQAQQNKKKSDLGNQ